MNREQAEAKVEELRGIVPASWEVVAHNTEIRPGKPERYKVVAWAAGLDLVVHPDTQKVYVNINNGPGPIESLSPRIYGDKGFDDAAVAFETLKDHIATRHKRVSAQFASFEENT
jgi:hypothetical protein